MIVEVRSRVSQLAPLEPEVLDSNTVRYWSRTTQRCVGSQWSKAKKLIDYDCVQYAGQGEFVVLPLNGEEFTEFAGQQWRKKPYPKNYNKKGDPYVLRPVKSEDGFECNCQWAVKMGKTCAHILALRWAFKLKKFSPHAPVNLTEGCVR
jgi:hypothetical protein